MINAPRWVLFSLQLFSGRFYKIFIKNLAKVTAHDEVNKIQYGVDGVMLDPNIFFNQFEARAELDLGFSSKRWAIENLSAYRINSKVWAIGATPNAGDNVHEHNRFKFVGVKLFRKVHWFQVIPPCGSLNSSEWQVRLVNYSPLPWVYLHTSSTRTCPKDSLLPYIVPVAEREFYATFMENYLLGNDVLHENLPLSKMVANSPAFLSLADLHNLYSHPEKFDGGDELEGVPSEFIKKIYNLPSSLTIK